MEDTHNLPRWHCIGPVPDQPCWPMTDQPLSCLLLALAVAAAIFLLVILILWSREVQ